MWHLYPSKPHVQNTFTDNTTHFRHFFCAENREKIESIWRDFLFYLDTYVTICQSNSQLFPNGFLRQLTLKKCEMASLHTLSSVFIR